MPLFSKEQEAVAELILIQQEQISRLRFKLSFQNLLNHVIDLVSVDMLELDGSGGEWPFFIMTDNEQTYPGEWQLVTSPEGFVEGAG